MFLLLLAACMTRESFPEQYAEAACEQFERCGTEWEANADVLGVETCEDYVLNGVSDRTYTDEWTPEAAAECVRWVREEEPCGAAPEDDPCMPLWDEPRAESR